jgi:all-trans-retinol dehydrogenase (NAD+)
VSRSVNSARVLISGAASGMGLLYAKRAAAEGASAVALWDRDKIGLTAAAKAIRSLATHPRFTVSTHEVDLASLDEIDQAAAATLQAIGTPDVLINNAGIVSGNDFFWETDTRSQSAPTLAVNTLAHMHVTRVFLPAMIDERHRSKRILNIASAAATVSNPRMSVYAASKWALYGWSDSVRLELRQAGHHHISVTTFCPSYVSTGMFRGARGMMLTPIISPDDAVQAAWSAMLRGKPVQLTPKAVNLAKILRGLLPVKLWDRVAQTMGVYRSMDKFTGRD